MKIKRVRIPEAGAVLAVRYPVRVFGRWSVTLEQPRPRLRNTAAVYCGDDGRLKVEWASNLGAGVNHMMQLAVNQTLASMAPQNCR